MRTLFTMLLMASLAQAQTKPIPAQGPPPKNLTKKADGRFSANGDPANAEKFEIYVVKTGDTLSAIAGRTMKNTRLWPQLWEQNEHIVNPHWIYPNDKILIKPVTVITQAAPPTPAPVPAPPAPEPEPARPIPPAVIPAIQPPALSKAIAVFDLRQWTLAPEIKLGDLYCAGFVRKTTVSTDLIVSAKYDSGGSGLATQGEYIYFSRKAEDAVNPGDTFQVIRPTRQLGTILPESHVHHDLGMHYLDVAQIQVLSAQPDFALARVSRSCEAIELGDIMIPGQQLEIPAVAHPRQFNPLMRPSGQMQGSVVITKNVLMNFGSMFRASGKVPGTGLSELEAYEKGVAAPGGIVYVDVGSSSGIKPGDSLIVYREIELNPHLYSPPEAKKLKHEKTAVGELIVLKVEETASSAIVTYSSAGVLAGDSVERR